MNSVSKMDNQNVPAGTASSRLGSADSSDPASATKPTPFRRVAARCLRRLARACEERSRLAGEGRRCARCFFRESAGWWTLQNVVYFLLTANFPLSKKKKTTHSRLLRRVAVTPPFCAGFSMAGGWISCKDPFLAFKEDQRN